MSVQPKVVRGIGLLLAGLAFQFLFSGVVTLFGYALILVGWYVVGSHLAGNPAQHWKVVNIMMRLFGFAATIVGTVFITWAIYYRLHPERVELDTNSLTGRIFFDFFLVGGAAVGIGLSFLFTPACRPDLGDPIFSDRAMRLLRGLPKNFARPSVPGRESRTWWTGETRSPH
jgi:hypothetical protein